MSLRIFTLGLLSIAMLAGCSSSKIRERREQREKVSQSARLYCDFVNGEMYPDVEVALNLEMAKRCDADKPFSLTNYKTPAENPGILYCCSTVSKAAAPAAVFEKPKKVERAEKKEEKKEEKAEEKKDEKSSGSETIE